MHKGLPTVSNFEGKTVVDGGASAAKVAGA